MWLGILFGGLKSILRRVFGFVMERPWQAALIIAVAASAWMYVGKQDALAKYEREAKQRGDDLLAYKAAQAIAAQKNLDDVARRENERKDIASANDVETRGDIDAAIAHARKLWQDRANSRVASCASAGEVAATPADTLGAGAMPELFTEDDVRICAANTVKAVSWQKFYSDLMAAE